MFDREQYQKRVAWYQHDRFGMFIHWGLYAIPARGEWVRNAEELSVEDYQPFFDEFNPVDYDPRKWAKLAKEAGMIEVISAAFGSGIPKILVAPLFCILGGVLSLFASGTSVVNIDNGFGAGYLAAMINRPGHQPQR